MKKKIIIIAAIVVVAVVAGIYFLVLSPTEKEPEISFYEPGEYFVTNIKDSKRLLQATIVLELATDDPAGTAEYLTENNHILRDAIVFALREKTEEELRSIGIEDELRKRIVAELLEKMDIDYIQTIYFNDYVIQ